MQKALEQDSSVYEYDSVYDDIQKQRLESNQKILGGTDKRVSLSFFQHTSQNFVFKSPGKSNSMEVY